MLIISSERFARHVTPPGHPERVERAHVFDAVAASWVANGERSIEPRLATRPELERVHTPTYLDELDHMRGRTAELDPDTFTSTDSIEIAHLAAGAAVQAAEHAVRTGEPAFALIRPPGHHAEPNRAMGFCFINNVAVAAAALLDRGLTRIAIVDIDVHHGNGTQHMFYGDPRVLYVSTHQYPFYPGTGAATEVGEGEGRGYTANIAMDAGCGDADYALVYRAVIEPLIDSFAPQLLLVSAGFDAHELDPLASMRVTTDGYDAIVRGLAGAGRRHGAVAFLTEGGYHLSALAACLERSFAAIAGASAGDESGHLQAEPKQPAARGAKAIAATRHALSPFWKGI